MQNLHFNTKTLLAIVKYIIITVIIIILITIVIMDVTGHSIVHELRKSLIIHTNSTIQMLQCLILKFN